jgi:hypothetical protein
METVCHAYDVMEELGVMYAGVRPGNTRQRRGTLLLNVVLLE